jgi:hypothetical protein
MVAMAGRVVDAHLVLQPGMAGDKLSQLGFVAVQQEVDIGMAL